MSSQLETPERADAAGAVKLFLCGDVMLGRGIDQIMPYPNDPQIHEDYATTALAYVQLAERANGPIPRPVGFAYVWGDALDELREFAPDLRIINLETSITRSNAYIPKGINYRMSPDHLPCLLEAGVDCCVLANNHVLDWGHDGLLETLEVLRRHRIRTVGAGRNLAEARAPAVLEIARKGRVIVFSFAMTTSGTPAGWAATEAGAGVHLADLSDVTVDGIAEQIGTAKRPGDVVIVSIHWGPNWGYAIPQEQRGFAHALIDRAGASIVHGHSSHHFKAIEVYRNRLILYGCGDFLNDYEGIGGHEAFRSDLALMYLASLDPACGDLLRLDLTPLQIRHFRLHRATPEDARWVHDRLARESRRFGAGVERSRSGDRLVLSWIGR